MKHPRRRLKKQSLFAVLVITKRNRQKLRRTLCLMKIVNEIDGIEVKVWSLLLAV